MLDVTGSAEQTGEIAALRGDQLLAQPRSSVCTGGVRDEQIQWSLVRRYSTCEPGRDVVDEVKELELNLPIVRVSAPTKRASAFQRVHGDGRTQLIIASHARSVGPACATAP